MNGDLFRKYALGAVDSVARFLDAFPELNCTITIRGTFGTIIVGGEQPEGELAAFDIPGEDEDIDRDPV